METTNQLYMVPIVYTDIDDSDLTQKFFCLAADEGDAKQQAQDEVETNLGDGKVLTPQISTFADMAVVVDADPDRNFGSWWAWGRTKRALRSWRSSVMANVEAMFPEGVAA